MQTRRRRSILVRLLHGIAVVVGAVAITVICFLILPIIQTINTGTRDLVSLTTVQTVDLPPPPPPPEEEEEEEPEEPEEEPPPELVDDVPPLDLEAIENLLNPGSGVDGIAGDFTVRLNVVDSATEDVDALFAVSDLDQPPRPVHQPSPVLDRRTRERTPGTVHVIFIVDREGRVESPAVQRSSDPALEKSALAAVRQWRFEPGKRNGQPVRVRTRVTITFPKES